MTSNLQAPSLVAGLFVCPARGRAGGSCPAPYPACPGATPCVLTSVCRKYLGPKIPRVQGFDRRRQGRFRDRQAHPCPQHVAVNRFRNSVTRNVRSPVVLTSRADRSSRSTRIDFIRLLNNKHTTTATPCQRPNTKRTVFSLVGIPKERSLAAIVSRSI